MFDEINDLKKIHNILELVKKSENIVHIRNNLNEYSGFLNSITDNYIVFYSKFKINDIADKVAINFIYADKYYYFETKIIKTEKSIFYLDTPKKIYIHVKRRFKRYNVKGFDVKAKIKIISLKTKEYFFVANSNNMDGMTEIYEEYKKDIPDLKKILSIIMKKLQHSFDKVKINLKIDAIDNKNIILQVIKITQKPFFISNAFMKNSYFTNVYYPEVVSYKNYFDLLHKQGVKNDKIEKFIENRITYYRKANIFAELYYPLFLQENFLGYIHLISSKKNITKADINYVGNMVKLLVESMIKAKLNSISEDAIQLKVKDISFAGIGLIVEEKLLLDFIDTEIKLKVDVMSVGKDICNFIGVVKRKILYKNNAVIGLETTEILPTQKLKLENFIKKYFESVTNE